MRKGQLTVNNDLGLHARAAAQLVRSASGFQSKVTLSRPDMNIFADARSILSLLTLAAAKGTTLELIIDGADEDAAWDAVTSLFENGFGEYR
jgi:phosphocarrier protein HPr